MALAWLPKNICQKLVASDKQQYSMSSWLWHHAGSQRQKEAKNGGIKEDGKTGERRNMQSGNNMRREVRGRIKRSKRKIRLKSVLMSFVMHSHPKRRRQEEGEKQRGEQGKLERRN